MRKPGRRSTELREERLGGTGSDEVEVPMLSPLAEAAPLDTIRRREIAARLQSAFDGLPSYHRAVIVLRELEGLSYEEMAVALGVSKGTIMSRLFHARQKLQKALADCYQEQIGLPAPGEPTATDARGER